MKKINLIDFTLHPCDEENHKYRPFNNLNMTIHHLLIHYILSGFKHAT